LRRAFSVFVPAELEAIGGRVRGLLDLGGPGGDLVDLPLPDEVVAPREGRGPRSCGNGCAAT
jgi:hypothetical protein